ncbi:ISNCY family transposase [Pararobbsia silviterrae]|uniref:ISNCY family transposase n=1 Tax=Pararobbsia silviterrae TaxID=1792498 RepID=A0A494XRN4_9BURK|nr:ISNCY family transposase [Pararobbsia silviterrae]RKP53307.1 ISNCY family transposase [Pararobbsia silviterrae]
MSKHGLITVSMRELERVKIITAVTERRFKVWQAAERLDLSVRQIARLCRLYSEHGPSGLVSHQRGHPSNRELPIDVRARVVALVRERYLDFGPTLAREKLYECHGITIGKETLRRWMCDAGLWIPRKQRLPKIYQPRARRACFGELIQIDGCEHAWFEDRAPICTLLVFVDDATSRLMMLHLTATESTFSYFEATRAYLERYGKPVAFYSDKASVFHLRHPPATAGRMGITQYGRALYELNIETWCANSSAAKGRVERAHLTLQDRLVKELRLRGIDTKEAANAYAPAFMADYNARFAKAPRSAFDAHRPLRDDEDLDRILTWRVLRKVTHVLTVQYDRVIYLLEDTPANQALIHQYIDVVEYPDGRIEIWADGVSLPYVPYDRLAELDPGAVVDHKRLGQALQVAQAMQAQRDDRRAQAPSRTNRGEAVREHLNREGRKTSRAMTDEDFKQALERSSPRWNTQIGKPH